MPQSIKPMGLIRKPGGGFDFKNKGNNRANEKAPPGREKQVKALKGKVDNPYAVAWASYNKSKNKKENIISVLEQMSGLNCGLQDPN
jgi:hypothetical protein